MSFRTEDKKLISRVEKMISSGNISHAYIVEGDTLTDKMGFAKDFLKEIMSADELLSNRIEHENYEDLYIVRANEGANRSVKSIKDEDMENLQANLKMKPHGSRNLAIIDNADSMTVRAQNRFLKTLEEPTPGTVIILLSENEENLLETIRSRCITLRLFERKEKTYYSDLANMIIDGEKFTVLKKKMVDDVKSRDDAYELLDVLENNFDDILVGKDLEKSRIFRKEEVIRAIELIEETRRDIVMNMNYSYALKNLIIKLEG